MRRFYTAAEQLDRAEFWHTAAERVPEGYFDDYETNPEMSTLYRGINLNSADIGDWTNPENILRALGDNLGHSWTSSYQYARHRARASGNDRDRDKPPGDLQVLLQSTWDGRTGWNRDYPGSLEGEHEINLNGGTPVRLDQIEIRPAGVKRWRKLLKEPIHHVAGRTAAPADLEWRHNLDGGPNEWELIADPPTGPTQVVQTENSPHQHYGMARRISPGNYEHDTDYGTFGIRQVPDHLRDADDPYRGGPSWYLHPPTWDGSPDEAPSDVYWTKRDALDAIRQMESDPDSYGLTRTAGAYSDQMYADAASEIEHIWANPTLPGMATLPRSPKITTDPYAGPPGFDAPSQPYLPGMEVVDTADDTLRDLARRPPEESADSYGDRLEKALYDEFMDWWPKSRANLTRTDENGKPDQWVTTNWRSFPDQPITHWMNVEDFLNERHPDAATGSNYGYEEAGDVMGMLDQPEYLQPTPERLREMGYTSLGNVITQAMLNLHNKLQGRTFASDSDRDRYMRLMLKHLGPQKAARLARLVRTADNAREWKRQVYRDLADKAWKQRQMTPAEQRSRHRIHPSRPQPGDEDFEGGPEDLPQDTLPGMEDILGESTRLWRGLPIDTSDPAFRRVWQMTYGQGRPVDDYGMFPDEDLRYEDRGGEFDHPGLADAILDGLEAKGGVGEHHSTSFDVADEYGRGIADGTDVFGAGPFLPVLLDSDWNGAGEDFSRAGSGNYEQEKEIALRHRQAPLTVVDVRTPLNGEEVDRFGRWNKYDDGWYSHYPDEPRSITAASSFSCPPGQPGCVSAMGVPDPDNTKMGPAGKKPTAEDYAEPWDANQTPADYTDYSVYSGVGGGGTGGGGSWGGSSGGSSGGGYGVNSGGKLLPGTQALNDALAKEFPGLTIGGWREDPAYPDEHPAGKALDLMTKDLSVGNAALPVGWANGADYAIWQSQMHYPDGRTAPYNGPNPHTDHVHFHHPGY